MKKQMMALVAASAGFLAFSAHAAEGAYIGADIGHATQNFSQQDKPSQNKGATAYQLNAGYNFNNYIGAEAGYVHFAKPNFGKETAPANAASSRLYLAAVGTLPLNDTFSVFAKLGMARGRQTVNVDTELMPEYKDGTAKTTRYSRLIGVGASLKIADNVALVAQYDNFGRVNRDMGNVKVKADMYSVGVRYQF